MAKVYFPLDDNWLVLTFSSHYSCTNTNSEASSSAEQMLQKLDNNLSFRQLFMLSLKYYFLSSRSSSFFITFVNYDLFYVVHYYHYFVFAYFFYSIEGSDRIKKSLKLFTN
jgi:hypothetical protein